MNCPECSNQMEKDIDSGVKCPFCGYWIPEVTDKIIPDRLEPDWNLDKPSSENTLKKIKDLEIPGEEMDNLSSIIMGCSNFNYLHRAFLHYCLGLKACLDMEENPPEKVTSHDRSDSIKIKVKGDETD